MALRSRMSEKVLHNREQRVDDVIRLLTHLAFALACFVSHFNLKLSLNA